MGEPLDATVRAMDIDDLDEVLDVVGPAFAGEPFVVPLQRQLAARPDNHGYVAEHDGRIVGHVGLTRCWIDAEPRLVEALVLSPLSVAPAVQRRGVGTALLRAAIAGADALGAPAVFLEGDPAYYSRQGWRPGAELGVTPASPRIPAPAFQCVRLPAYEDWMQGPVVYPDTFWQHDCVGLRGERLEGARAFFGL
ncbi:MAG TPA: N-acetyltransferase [Candidatus Nanopelagicales bacterium]|nr:N-acetyltransferase [Candidatus Nanopelagicales bacterium]